MFGLSTQRPLGYFAKDIIARFAFWFGLLTGVLVLTYAAAYPEAISYGIINLVMLFGGRMLYMDSRVGIVEDNPLQSKTPQQKRYATSPSRFVLAIVAGVAAVLALQYYVLSSMLFSVVQDPVFVYYVVVSASISESYLLHWGVQSNLSNMFNAAVGIIIVPLLAVVLHWQVYGMSGMALAATFLSFLIFALMYEWSRRLSVPILIHLIINLLSVW